jgi:hypothetical protein
MDGSFNMGYWEWWRILSSKSLIDFESRGSVFGSCAIRRTF